MRLVSNRKRLRVYRYGARIQVDFEIFRPGDIMIRKNREILTERLKYFLCILYRNKGGGNIDTIPSEFIAPVRILDSHRETEERMSSKNIKSIELHGEFIAGRISREVFLNF